MSVGESTGYESSVWDDPENNETAPKKCPNCGRELAHPEDLRENDNIDVYGTFAAYRRHREAHYRWGDDPRDDGVEYGDPYLANYYDGDRSAVWEPTDDCSTNGDPDEVVGNVYRVTIRYEAVKRAKVVAPDEHRAKEKVADNELPDGKDLDGDKPEAIPTQELHKETTELKEVTRSDEERAERMAGWPW